MLCNVMLCYVCMYVCMYEAQKRITSPCKCIHYTYQDAAHLHSLILDQIKLISRTYSSYGTLALDKSLSSRNVLHRYSLTFATESGDPQSVERPCPMEVMRMMVQAQYE